MRDHDAERAEQLEKLLDFIKQMNNRTIRYIDERIDERDDGMNLLLKRLEAWERETIASRQRIERIEAMLLAEDEPK